jgi:hypothetical protein
MPLYPIGFCIPKDKIVERIPIKTKLIAHIIPGDVSTYIYENERDYYADYQASWFGITKCKGGWDCMRHYEILANGCIPWFLDLDKCPKNTMTHFPKQMILEIMDIVPKNRFGMPDETQMTTSLYSILTQYIEKLIDYTRNYLTIDRMVDYILDRTSHTHVKRVLYLSSSPSPDYLRCLILQGFKQKFGKECHDLVRIPHIYKDYNSPIGKLYGKGITYSMNIDAGERDNANDSTIEDDICNHRYDIVVFGSAHRGVPYHDLVKKYYKESEIIILCGEDLHDCNLKSVLYTGIHGIHTFIREQ